MRKIPLANFLSEKGVELGERCGVEIPLKFKDIKDEYQIIRDNVGITDFSYMQKYRIPAETGLDFLDSIFVGNVAKIRFCRVLHTFLADDQGNIIADCYIANNDEDYIVFCESIVDDKNLDQIFEKNGSKEAGLENITDSHVVISIDGVKAWAVVKEIFGSDVLGLPYLSIETYPFEGNDISLFRAGKTSEFGYLVMASKENADQLMKKLLAQAQKHGGGLCGCRVHDELRLEGRFFNIFAEGLEVKDPLVLGLQWMIDFDKDSFIGRDAILSRRKHGLKNKIIGIRADSSSGICVGDDIYIQGEKISVVKASCFSNILKSYLGLALFPIEVAYAGLEFNLKSSQGPKVQSISMPPIVPKSLNVKLDEL